MTVFVVIFVIGLFYIELGKWVWLRVSHAWRRALLAGRRNKAPPDNRYAAAKDVALAIAQDYDRRPNLSQSLRVADHTYAILGAIHQIEELRQNRPNYPEPSVN
jgi:hypothetical protein